MTERPKPPAEIDLAALIRAQVMLGAESEDSQRAIAELLGFTWRGAPVTPPTQQDPAPVTPPPGPVAPRPDKFPKPSKSRRANTAPRAVDPETFGTSTSSIAADEALPKGVKPLPVADSTARAPELAHEPLLNPTWQRGLLTLLLATNEPSRLLDWRALERTTLKGEPLLRLPWALRGSLRRGTEVWLDVSPSMDPYARDQQALLDVLRALLGTSAVRVRHFEFDVTSSTRQVTWDRDEPREVVQGTTVLVLSDFGISHAVGQGLKPTTATSLTPWTTAARERGCRVLALVPASRESWPEGLERSLSCFEWDRPLSTRHIKASIAASRQP
jgi:hypothetical protein